MKKRIVLSVLAAFAALSCAAFVNVAHKTGLPDPDKRPGLTKERFSGTFENCKLWLEYTIEDGQSVWRKWGDYFFGLDLGGGRWSTWGFMRVFRKAGKGEDNLLFLSRPEVFFGYSADGADFVVAEWDEGEGKRLRLRFASYPSHRDWLFARVDFDGVDVRRVEFSSYPGRVVPKEGRELHLTTRERDWSLAAGKTEFAAESPLVLLTSRYASERTGGKLVYDVGAVETVSAPRCDGAASVSFFPKKEAKSMTFALGYFADRDPDDLQARFFGEEGDMVHGFLRGVDWEAMPKADDFRASVAVARSLGVPAEGLKPVVDRFKAALKARDVATVAACEAQVREMRSAAVADGLRSFVTEKKAGK